MANHFATSILKYVLSEIQNDKIIARDKLVEQIWQDCFPDGSPNERQTFYPLIEKQLENILNTDQNQPLVQFLTSECNHCAEHIGNCVKHCPVEAITVTKDGKHHIDYDLCIDCGNCITACTNGVIVARSDFARVAKMLVEETQTPVYAILAPTFVGQFGAVKPEQVKSAFSRLGFTDVLEVAMAADVITSLEAREFHSRVTAGQEFMITSCCCPAFIRLIERHQPNLTNVVSESISPMIALGRMLKAREPDCRVVFVGPCVAKKAEAVRPELADAIDCVLTFKETQVLLEASGLDALASFSETTLADASHDGRIFASSGGVTAAITRAVLEIDPKSEVRAVRGNGAKECNDLLKQAQAGILDANFIEGMACIGGCVGGPGTLISREAGAEFVAEHANQAPFYTALSNKKAKDWVEKHTTKEQLLSTKVPAPIL